MKILEGIEIIDKALWLEKEKVLVLADLHIGFEAYFNELGILVPRTLFKFYKEDGDSSLCLKAEVSSP